MITAIAVIAAGFTLGAPQAAEAAVVQWGTNSGTAPNYQANVNGDFIMAGNGVLACSATTATTNGTCADLHAASSTNANNVNDNFVMTQNNSVAGFTANSSSATMTIPAGATVVKAFLTWSANTGVYTGDTRRLCAQYSAARGVATMPSGSATGYTSRAIQLKVAGSSVINVSPQSMLADPASQATALYYSASADVTSAFASVPTGSEVTISAGNIWTPTGAGCYAGWSINVVYDYGTFIADNPASVPHNIIYYEGHVRQGANDADLTVAFNGFTAVAAGTRAGFTLFEGDRNITGDTASYSRGGSTPYTEIANAAGATGNVGISRAVGSVRYTGTAGTAFTNQNVDVATVPLTNVVAGDSTVNLRLGTSGDSYLLRNAMLSVPTAGLQIVKTFDGTADTQSRTSGELATFTIRITNTGAGTLRNIVVTDDQANCARNLGALTLAPLQTTTYTCTATAPSATGYVSTAEATARTVVGDFLAQDNDSTTVLLSAIGLTKTSALAPGGTGRAGDVVIYTFTVTNTGQSTLTDIVISDPLSGLSAITFGTWPGTVGTLTPGQSVTATANYTLKQSDVDAGSVANTATVSAADDDGGIRPSGSANRVTPIAAAGAVTVTKTGALASGTTGRVGDRINYTFIVRNTGNVTLANASLVDPLPGLSPPAITWPTATAGVIPVGQTATATAFYTITQADVDAGSVRNTATATARTPAGTTVSGSSPQVTVPTIASAPGLTTTKSGSLTQGNGGVGSTITYTFTARNSGNTTLTNVAISDPLAGLSALTYSWPGVAGTLAPAQSVTATATYTVTQADVDAGAVRNTATGTARTPAGAVLTVPSSQSVVSTAASAPAVTLTKSGALAPGSTGKAGDVVTYSFRLANSGNVTLTEVAIADPLAGLSALTYTWPGAAGTLAPGQAVTATATYTLKQSDVDAGSVANAATASALPPSGARLSQTRSFTLPVTPTGALTVLKSGSVTAGTGGVGSTVTYDFSATNNGNVTLTQVAIADPLPGLSAITYTWPGTAGTLALGQTVQGRATYTVRQADVDAGTVTNTATASARTPGGASVTGTSPTTRVGTVAAAPASTTTKTAAVSGTAAVGDVITYTVRTTNSGNVTLTDVAITDTLAGLSAFTYTWPGTSGRLAPGQTVTAVATYTIKQADVNAGSVRNVASSTALYGATPVTSTSGTVTTNTVAASAGIVTTKSGALQSGSSGRAGDTVVWSITLRNSGNVTLTGVSVADSLPGISAPTYGTWPSGTAGVLQPGQTVTATATSVISQTDVNSGAVSNTATGSGVPPTGAAVTSTAPATVSLASAPGLVLTKTGAITTGNGSVGSTITYSFSARNTGNVTLTGVAITDPHAGLSTIAYTWPGTAGTLQPNQTVTATATYTVRQSDVDAGSARNTASASGTPPTGAAITASSGEVTVATIAAAPGIAIIKTASGGGGGVGSVITYTFRASNTGNVTLTGVGIADPLAGLGALQYQWPGAAGTLAPGQTVVATAPYTVTQADVNAGSVTNTATATGTGGGATATAASGAVTTPTATSTPAVSVTKTGTLAGTGAAGDTITYAFTVRNSGNVTLTGVSLVDPLIGQAPVPLSGWPGAPGTLQPGQSVSGTATYTVKQTDVDAGAVANTATATGTPPRGAAVTGTAPSTVRIAAVPSIAVQKTGSVTTGSGEVGSTVTFAFTIRNSGNVTLSGVTLTDTLAGLSAPSITWPGSPNTLTPGQTATGTATYTVRQADVDAGSVRNTASVSGRPPTGAVVSATSTEAVVPTSVAAPGLTVAKSADTAAGTRVGDVITYTITATNSGNQTLTGVTLSDPLSGLSALAVTWPGANGVLAPGQTATARATYVITQTDVNSGSIRNRASATATAPGGASVNASSADVVTSTVTAAPRLTLDKTASLAPGATGRAGDLVTYSFTVRNAGNVTLTGVGIADAMPGLSAIAYTAWPGATGTLQPGQSVTATATRALTQSDVDAGSVANTATATGTPPSGDAVQATASATLPLIAGPLLTLGKAGVYTQGNGAVGSVISYTFTASNAGNVTLTDVAIADPHAGLSAIDLTWPGTAGTLAPGAQVVGTATYTVTQADVDAGTVRNTARVTGTPPSGPAVGADSQTVSLATVAAGPAVATTKSAAVRGSGAVGDVVDYTVRVTNTGNVTLRGVVVNDPMVGLTPFAYTWPGDAGVLAPGAQVVARASHTITQADVDAGSIVNVATGSGLSPNGTPVSAASGTVTTPTVAGDPRLQVVKSGTLPAGATGVAGETITWTVSIRNTGNVTLSGVTAADSLPGISELTYGAWPSGTAGVLAPGDVVTATATSTVRQTDVDAGAVSNAATAAGTPARGQATSAVGSATVPLTSAPALTIQKSGAYTAGTGSVGDTITYSYTVRNAGNVTLTGVAVSDPHSGLSTITYGTWASGTAGTLAPNQTITATATYQVRQSDVNAGSITDVATASGRPPTGAAVSATSQTVVLGTATPAPAILTTKTASVAGPGQLGDLITYTLRATNSGNVTLTGVALSDPAAGLSPLAYGPWPGASGTLQPGESVTATATHRITQADLDAGSVSNTATSTGAPPTGPAVTDPSDTIVTATAPQTPDIEVTKTGTLAGGATARAGDAVAYSFSLRNTGNVTLTGVALADLEPGVSPLVYSWPGAEGVLAPNQVVTATATYALTQADIDAGAVDNVVSGSGTAPGGASITENDDVTVPIAPSASIDVSKTGTVLGDGVGDGEAGDQIRFDFVVVNTGNVTLTDVELADSIPGLILTVTWPNAEAAGVLAPGATATAAAVYEITQADVNSGSVPNSVTASGAPPTGADVTDSASVEVSTGAQRSELRLSKSGTTLPNEAGLGDDITYTFVLSNTGNVTVTGIVISDPLVGLSDIVADWPGADGVLDPGQSVTATASLEITQEHVDAGRVLNIATASGTAPAGAVSTTSPQSIVPVEAAAPSVAVTNSGSLPPGSAAGSTVTWTYTLKNTGNVTLSGSALSDALAGTTAPAYQWNGQAGILAPGETVAATATTVLTQADVDAGSIISLVTGRGSAPSGAVVTATAPATVTIVSTAGLTLEKSATQTEDLAVGDIVTFTFDVTNSGTATIDAIALSDPLPGLSAITFGPWPAATGTLAPMTTVSASAQYTVTQADVDAGGVRNTATVTGLTPSDAAVSASDTVTLATETRAPALELVKADELSGDGVLGDSIGYSFTVRNAGNTTVADIAIDDELEGISGIVFGAWPSGETGRLAPGQEVTATAQYTIGQADVDAGEVVNTATATGTAPTEVDVSSIEAEVTTELAAAGPELTATKRGTLAAGSTGRAGDTVEFRFSVVNTGDVTVSEVAFEDALTGLSPLAITWPDAARPGVLVPGAEATATATYVLLQSDVDAGAVSNAVTVTGTPVRGTLAPVPAAATVPITPGAALSAVKTGVLAAGDIGAVGDTVEYAVVVTNTGNVTVTGGVLVDPMEGLYDVSIVWPNPAAPGRVGVGEQAVGRGKYDLTQADVDAGFVENTASVAASAPGGVRVSADTNTVRVNTVLPAAGLSVSKSGVASGSGAVGDVVSYEFGVTNTGNVTVSGVVLTDAVPGVVLSGVVWPDAGAPGVIAPGETATATGSYVIVQADVDAGRVVNTASASGVPARSEPITVVSPESVVATVAAAPAVSVSDSGASAPGATGRAGDVVTWTYVLTNDGNVTLTGAALADALAGTTPPTYTWTTPVGILGPGESVRATATYVLTQADVDAGSVTSLVTGTGTPSNGGAAVSATTPATVPIASAPQLVVTKDDAATGGSVGDTIDYSFTIENRGNVTLSGVVLSDTLAGLSTPDITWPTTNRVLAPGEVATATATYVITQSDVDAGSVTNTATANASVPGGASISASSDAVETPLDVPAPAVVTTKSAVIANAAGGAVGDVIEYTVTVRNSGNVTLDGVGIVDELDDLSDISVVWPGVEGVLAPEQTLVGTARYVITQADVDRGSVSNIAVGSGTDPTGTTVEDPSDQIVVPAVTASADATVTKSGVLAPGATGRAGDTVQFSFRIVNTGNVTLSSVTIDDPLDGLSDIQVTWPGADGLLAPGATADATAEYALTQADVDRGRVDNTVALTASAPGGAPVERTATATVPIAEAAELTTVKSGQLLEPGIGAVGDVIEYRLVVTNTGNVTVQDGRLIDRLAGLSLPEIEWPGPEGELLVGDTVVGIARYTLTQADIDRGFVRNVAGVEAVTEQGSIVVADSNPVVINTVQPAAALTVVKDGVVDGDGGAGGSVDYTFRITNTGNVTVSAIALADPMPGLSVPQVSWPGAEGVLAPGQTAIATARYTITQTDVDAGSIANAATASGSSRGGPVTSPAGIETVDTQGIQASIVVDKTAALAPDATGIAGDIVTWSYSLRNTSNVTLTGVALADRVTGSTAPEYTWPDPARPGVLLPGQTVTAVSTYALTQADIDRGGVASAVDGVGTPPRGADVNGTSTASVEIAARPGIAATKSGLVDGAGDVGDRIDYTFGITNTGNVTLTLVDLVDALVGVSSPTFDWPGEPGILLPGETVDAAAEYTITQADVDRGSVTNIATASGKPPVGDTITASTPPTNTSVAAAAPELLTGKTASVRGEGAVGDIIDYSFTIENTGNVTVSAITLTDPLAGLSVPNVRWPGDPGVLAPGEIATAIASYAIVQADVDAGEVVNIATAAGSAPSGAAVQDASDRISTPTVAADAGIMIDKSGALAPGSTGQVGDVVQFGFTIANIGNQTLSDVDLSDALPGLSVIDVVWPSDDPAAAGVLPVGSTARGTATYALTQADIDAGSVANAVEVFATTPAGAPVDAADAATVTIPRTPALSAVKTGVLAAGDIGAVGDTVEYAVVVTNTGNVTVTGGVLVDPMEGLYDVSIVWPNPAAPGRVGVGEQAVGRGKYDLTQADVDAGFVENTASVAASAPGGVRVSADTNTVRVNTVLPAAGLSVSKSGVASGSGAVGDVVSYEFGVTNTGNVTVSGVVLTDAVPGVVLSGVVWPDAGAPGVIAPGETATATGSYVIVQADADAGRVVNTASASGVPARSEPITVVSPESVVATVAAAPAVSVSDSGALAPGATGRAGDVVTWTYVLTNDGNVTLTGAALADALPGASAPVYVWPGSEGVLVPGESVRATATYVLTQADVDAGSVTSLVTGTGQPPMGAPAAATTPATVSLVAAPGLVFEKTGNLDAADANEAGDGVTFDFRIENTGTVTLSGVAITDELVGIGTITVDWPAAAGVLAPGQIARGTAPYDISQEDVDRGSVQNTASVRATTPAGEVLSTRSTIEPIPTAEHAPSIQTVKGGAYISGTGGVGSIIEYTFDITNTGNVTLRLIRLQDDLEGLGTPQIEFPSATGILPPGGTATGVARYTVTQDDVDAGSITNVATSFGTSPRGVVVSDSSAPFTIATDAPTSPGQAIRATQSAELAAGDVGVLGDSIDYTFTIQNTGNTTLNGVTLSNTVSGLTGFVYTWPDAANPGRLLPGQTVTITASHLITQADVDAGTVRNTATGSGTPPTGADVSSRTPMTIVPLAGGTGSIDVSKTGTRLGDGSVGTQIRYDFVITNTGTFSLSSVALTDSLDGLSDISYGAWPDAVGTLAPGGSVTAAATYTLQQSDIDAGEVRNTASASALTPGGDSVTSDSPESVVTTIAAAPAIDVEKSQVLAQGANGRPGDLVEYTFTFTNTGNTTLRGITLSDGQAGLTGLGIAWPGEIGVLAPGQSATATATYALTQADVDAGVITSVAVATGDGGGTIVRDEASGETVITAAPALTLDKTAELTGAAQQGGGIRYLVTVTNTGNVTLSDVAVTDDLAGLGAPTVTWPGTPGVLAAGQSATVTADYVITAADVVRQHVENTASVVGTAPDGSTAEASDSVRVEVPGAPSISLGMSIAVKDGQQGFAGDTLVFRYTATNTGTTTLTGVRITDPYPGLSAITYVWPGEPGVLLPGQRVTATATVIITPAMEGTVVNSRAVVTSVEADSGVQVLDVASDAVNLPQPTPTGLLPFTGGGDPLPLVGGSALLLLAGLVLMLAARRRRSMRPQNLSS
ncbi:AraC family transcriptional regulator [Microbacterium sp. LWH13-1.2]|uniref:beta strand repeat-containing protein n=1 Tax=Microbacterium sp. LWH13-1.2 TaxID=3135260 RepID=UPI00313909C7